MDMDEINIRNECIEIAWMLIGELAKDVREPETSYRYEISHKFYGLHQHENWFHDKNKSKQCFEVSCNGYFLQNVDTYGDRVQQFEDLSCNNGLSYNFAVIPQVKDKCHPKSLDSRVTMKVFVRFMTMFDYYFQRILIKLQSDEEFSMLLCITGLIVISIKLEMVYDSLGFTESFYEKIYNLYHIHSSVHTGDYENCFKKGLFIHRKHKIYFTCLCSSDKHMCTRYVNPVERMDNCVGNLKTDLSKFNKSCVFCFHKFLSPYVACHSCVIKKTRCSNCLSCHKPDCYKETGKRCSLCLNRELMCVECNGVCQSNDTIREVNETGGITGMACIEQLQPSSKRPRLLKFSHSCCCTTCRQRIDNCAKCVHMKNLREDMFKRYDFQSCRNLSKNFKLDCNCVYCFVKNKAPQYMLNLMEFKTLYAENYDFGFENGINAWCENFAKCSELNYLSLFLLIRRQMYGSCGGKFSCIGRFHIGGSLQQKEALKLIQNLTMRNLALKTFQDAEVFTVFEEKRKRMLEDDFGFA